MAKRRPKTKHSRSNRTVDVTTRQVSGDSIKANHLQRLFNFVGTNPVLVCILLSFIVALVFLPVLGNGFVQWDDDITLYKNPHVQGLDSQRLQWMFTDVSYTMRYKPLAWVSLALIHAISELKPFSYHLLSLLFHCANTALIFLIFHKLLRRSKDAETSS